MGSSRRITVALVGLVALVVAGWFVRAVLRADDTEPGGRPGAVMEHSIDGTSVRTKAEFMAAVADALSFPDWFGHNLDALHDCLVDLSWLPAGEHVLVWSAPEVLRAADPRAYAAIDDVLRGAAEPGRFRVEVSPR